MKFIKRILIFFIIALISLSILFVGVGYVNYRKAVSDAPIEEKIAEIRGQKHYVKIEDIAPSLLQATVSIEDRRFYEHNGVDYRSLGRALVDNLFAKGIVGGGSTITQQLGKNLYFDYQPSYIRKMSEIFLAYDLEKELSKQEILELYVNVINYGDNHMGIYEASMGYFHKAPKDLDVDEATLLAGLPQSPSNYQLSNHEDAARIRQKQVLQAMVRDQHISNDEMLKIIQE
ncbi:transglycosylase domain-containing protein [[Eubacterium] hominis]|uniref:transglycosylase domain-containing protein n=1 Tax=[Eubacterium] hominis TaxID=2764325 RepID=UPI003A4E60E3